MEESASVAYFLSSLTNGGKIIVAVQQSMTRVASLQAADHIQTPTSTKNGGASWISRGNHAWPTGPIKLQSIRGTVVHLTSHLLQRLPHPTRAKPVSRAAFSAAAGTWVCAVAGVG